MAAQKPAQARGLELEPLNLTPLLDVLFNLIFFFVLATTLKEEIPVMKVAIPESDSSESVPLEAKEWIVTMTADGQLFLDSDAVTSGELKTQLLAAAESPEGARRVRIRGDRGAVLQQFVDLMGLLVEAKHTDVQLDIDRRRSP